MVTLMCQPTLTELSEYKYVSFPGTSIQEEAIRPIKPAQWLFVRALFFLNAEHQARKHPKHILKCLV